MDYFTTILQNAFLRKLNEGLLSKFLATFPIQLQYKQPEPDFGLWVFWSQNNSSPNDFGLIHEASLIHEKIKSSLSEVQSTRLNGLILFWAPVKTGDRWQLTTSGQPFALKHLDPTLQKYRTCSLRYQYNIDVNKLEVVKDPMIITGAPASAFLNCLPELELVRVHEKEESPLLCYALECQLEASFVLPIYDPSKNCCVGVVECCSKLSDNPALLFHELNSALEGAGLSTFHVQQRLSHKTMQGLKHAKDELKDALMIICESHNLGLAQVWMADEDKSHVLLSSSLDETQKKRLLALKLTGYSVYSNSVGFYSSLRDYSNVCDMVPLKMEEELVVKTLQDYEPRYCRNISKLSNNRLHALLPAHGESSCLVLCLRSMDTGEFDYVFEFIWLHSSNHVILLEALLLSLNRCLPSFKFASGAKLCDRLCVIDVNDSTRSETEVFKIFQGNRFEAVEEGTVFKKCKAPLEVKCKTTPISLTREFIEQQFGRTMKEAAKNLNVSLSTLKRKCKDHNIFEWQGPQLEKRKVNDPFTNQSYTNEEDNGAIQDPLAVNKDKNTVTIKAECANDLIKFHLPICFATIADVEKEIGKKFKLNNGTYKLKYLDEDGDWILLISDQDMMNYIKSSRISNQAVLRLRVLPYT